MAAQNMTVHQIWESYVNVLPHRKKTRILPPNLSKYYVRLFLDRLQKNSRMTKLKPQENHSKLEQKTLRFRQCL